MEMDLLNKILEKLEQLDLKVDHGLNSLRSEMNERFENVDATLLTIQETVNRIEISQQDDIHSVLVLINTKLEDTAKKSDIDSLRQDIEFTVKENSLFKLELDRLKRNAYE